MIRLIEGQDNQVEMSVASSVDTTGFTVKVTFCGDVKTVSEIKDGGSYTLTFSAADVATVPDGLFFGTVEVLTSNGDTYKKDYVQIERVKSLGNAIDYQKLPLVLAATWVGEDSGGGGGGDYVTHSELQESSANDRSYTDEKVSDVVVEALEGQTVTIKDKDGHDISLTVKESMQNTENLKGSVQELEENQMSGSVIDEDPQDGQPDDETLYFDTGKIGVLS